MRGLFYLLAKDFRSMVHGRFFLLVIGSLVLYSCYIQFFYINTDQSIFPIYLHGIDTSDTETQDDLYSISSRGEMQSHLSDHYSIGVTKEEEHLQIHMVTSGSEKTDNLRAAYAYETTLSQNQEAKGAEIIGGNSKTVKNRLEMTSEVLFFELVAIGFLGISAILFKEKQMGVIRVHGILPISRTSFILSKLSLFLLTDFVFAILLTIINLNALSIDLIVNILIQTGILSIIMILLGLFFALCLRDFKRFSLFYLVFAIFATTPVFLAVQTSIDVKWVKYHPFYHLFSGLKNAYFSMGDESFLYYLICGLTMFVLFLFVRFMLGREMIKEG
ncbi:hypothetical protein ACS127_12840 [Amphibacillus sp. Q70]|uniref:hypothetical protein n=1 Tax=Amphibacillus sp. Q70 TaxID=3453416 RepID=UPI003F8616D2